MERMIDFTYYVQTDKFNFYNNNYCKFMSGFVVRVGGGGGPF